MNIRSLQFEKAQLACLLLAVTLVAMGPDAASAIDSFSFKVDETSSFVSRPIHEEREPIERDVKAGDTISFGYVIPLEYDGQPNAAFTVSITVESPRGRARFFKETVRPTVDKRQRGWQSRRMPLDKFAGQHVKFRFSSTSTLHDKDSFHGAIWGGVRIGNFKRKPGEFNIVLLSVDTLRWDHLGVAGYSRDTSPQIDELANNGVYFRKAVAQSSWTKPSHMSLFSSLYPSLHGMEADWGQHGTGRRLPSRFPMVTEVLQENGYLTQAFTGSAHVTAVVGFDRGFDEFQEFALPDHSDGPHTYGGGINFIREHAADKFFLFVHTYEVHGPRRHKEFVTKHMAGKVRLDAKYDSGILYVSNLIGELVKTLEEEGIRQNTMIVLFSDHGDTLGDRGMHGHGNSLYDELVLVPLIFNMPGELKPRKVVDFNAQLVDVFPTICDLIGVKPPNGLVGRSLKPILMGEDLPEESVGVSELTWNQPGGKRTTKKAAGRHVDKDDDETRVKQGQRLTALRRFGDGCYKIVYSPAFASGLDRGRYLGPNDNAWRINLRSGGKELFDLATDPGETTNLAQQAPSIFDSLQRRFEEEMSRGPVRTSPTAEPDEPEKALDPSIQEQLRSLGY